MKQPQSLKLIIVLGSSQTALSTLRCIASLRKEYIIWLLGRKGKFPIAFTSNIPDRKIDIQGNSWVESLLSLALTLRVIPGLLLTEDEQVVEISEREEELSPFYKMLLPSNKVVTTLMEKSAFTRYAIDKRWAIPKTEIVQSRDELIKKAGLFSFPIILKPYLMHACRANSIDELKTLADTFSKESYKSFILQEFIPGNDDNLFFCFLLFNQKGNYIHGMVAQKLRQWPVHHGTTSLARTVEPGDLLEQSKSVLSAMQYIGYGSVEFKRNPLNNRYYIMEPTVGRFNQQILLSKKAGLNLPLQIVQLMVKEKSPEPQKTYLVNKFWIYESNDFFSFLRDHKYGYFRNYFKSSSTVLFDWKDPLPLFAEIYYMIKNKLRKN